MCKQIVLNFHPTNGFQLVRLANYIGCDHFLEMAASRLGAVVLTISNPKPIGNMRGLIHSRYRAHSKFLESTWTKCAKCEWILIRGKTVLQRPQLNTTPCRGADENLGCNKLDTCRHCNTNSKVLLCVACNNEIVLLMLWLENASV